MVNLYALMISSKGPSSPLIQLLTYKDELLSLLKLLHNKTFSKRGYSWSGKLLSSVLLTLTHTYPMENKFVNPDEWKGAGMSMAQNLVLD